MKRIIRTIAALVVCISVSACHAGAGHDHDHDHDHETEMHDHDHGHEHHHDHDGDEHDHDHDHDHNHEHHHDHDAEAHDHDHGEEGHGDEIVFSIEKQEKFGIKVREAHEEPFSAVFRTSGEILPASGDEVTLSATTSGVFHFKGKSPSEGSTISKGSVFGTINTQSIDGGDPVSKAKAAYETAEKEYLRDVELLKDNIISASHFEQSKLEYEQAKAAYEALTRSGYGANGLNILAPMGGYLKSLYVSEGQYVSTGEAVAVISQNRRLQLRAELPEKYFAHAKDIVSANFTTPDGVTHTLDELNGRLLSYGRNASSHFLPITFELDNSPAVLPGAMVEVYLKTRPSEESIVVPLSAVVESQGIYSVFVQHEPDAFMKKDVRLGMSDGVSVQILEGLEHGDMVVVNGAVQIKLASVSVAPAGHNHQH